MCMQGARSAQRAKLIKLLMLLQASHSKLTDLLVRCAKQAVLDEALKMLGVSASASSVRTKAGKLAALRYFAEQHEAVRVPPGSDAALFMVLCVMQLPCGYSD